MKFAIALALVTTLHGCSLFQRSFGEEEAPPPATASGPAGEEAMATPAGTDMEAEVAKLNAKLEALETKLEVMQHSVERNTIRAAQPEIKAEPLENPTLASSVGGDEEGVKHTASAVESPRRVSPGGRRAEADFQAAMTSFQKGAYSESAAKFAAVARENHGHLLAAHALYWAGEASARARQWSTAADYWQELERTYPTSTYMPEALAGLSRAHEQQGNIQKANSYRTTLLRAFPNAPVALNAVAESRATKKEATVEAPVEPEAPVVDEESE
ncbi:MAG: hypothetical protein HUU37_01105 [Bdellovibrionales bacterium]|nr:hypothetical protein [Bdellovibrionales bacterium]